MLKDELAAMLQAASVLKDAPPHPMSVLLLETACDLVIQFG
jgi:hypothetical protein